MSPDVPFALGLLVVGISLVFLLWWLPQRQIQRVASALEVSDRVDLEIKSRGVLAQIAAGLFLVIGLFSTWKSFELSRQGQVSERLVAASEKLGSSYEVPVRVAAIEALVKIAADSPRDKWTVMEVLAAYVRERAKWPSDPGFIHCRQKAAMQDKEDLEPYAPSDIQLALNTLKRQDWAAAPFPLDLRRTDLRGADLDDGNFYKALFNGSYLGGARLSGTDLRNAHLLHVCVAEYTQCSKSEVKGAEATGALLDGLNDCPPLSKK